MLNTYENNSKKRLWATTLSVITIAGIVVLADHLNSENSAAANTGTQAVTATPASSQNTSLGDNTGSSSVSSGSGSYKDGTFTASSDYFVPHGQESIKVSLTLNNGVVTNASVHNSEGDHESAAYQQDFASAYKSYVVGQKINNLKLDIIAGASDTTQGFNDAVSQIASQAQA